MKRALRHGHHKLLIMLFVFAMAVLGIWIGIKNYGVDYLQYNVEIVTLTLMFINTGLLLTIVAILLHMEEERE